MNPRITINRNKDGELEIWLNESGRDLLVRELQQLSEANDHVHLMPEEQDFSGAIGVRNIAYQDGDEVLEWGKILFRPDKWDAEYFPHVLAER
jgi:hypothetical protein